MRFPRSCIARLMRNANRIQREDGVTRKCRRCSSEGRRPVRSRIADRAPRSPTFVPTARYVDGSTHRGMARCRELHSSDDTSSSSTDVKSTESSLRVPDHAARSNELLRNSPASTPDDMANIELVLLHAVGRRAGRGAEALAQGRARDRGTPRLPSRYRAAIKVSRTRLWARLDSKKCHRLITKPSLDFHRKILYKL